MSGKGCTATISTLRRRHYAAQDFPRRLGAIHQAQSAAFDLPSRGRADEVPAIGDHAMDVIAARAAMIGNLDGFAGFSWRQNLQIGNHHGGIAVNRDAAAR